MRRIRFLGLCVGAMTLANVPLNVTAAETDLTLHTPTGDIFGTLSLPASRSQLPVVLIVAGSGPTDRNGNNPILPGSNDAYRLLANALASAGIASVRYDKRGIAASAKAAPPAESDLHFDMYVDDVVAWMKLLRADKRFSRVVIAGHSEGSLLGIIASEQIEPDAFVSLEGAGRPALVILREQLKRQYPPDLYAQADAIMTKLQAGQTTDVPLSSPLAPLLHNGIQPYLISWFKYDPAAEIAKLRTAVTIVQGTADVQVTMADARALAQAARGSKLVVVEGMNHVLKHAPDTSSQAVILAGYENPNLPVEPKVVAAVSSAATTVMH